ncbi:hypothetical protein Tco_1007893, partial [Tanacetum coccineum]
VVRLEKKGFLRESTPPMADLAGSSGGGDVGLVVMSL